MDQHIVDNAEAVAEAGAETIAREAQAAIDNRGRFLLAVSGGHTPWAMLKILSGMSVPWASVHVFQVDERVAAVSSPDRNYFHLKASLLDRVPIPADNIHPMPVEADDLAQAAVSYSDTLTTVAGIPPVLDLIHLGLGPDGHTASLVPGDPVLDKTDAYVALAGPYQGHPRMTLTYPVLDAARKILFITDGTAKIGALAKLVRGDRTIPASRIEAGNVEVIADRAAMGETDDG